MASISGVASKSDDEPHVKKSYPDVQAVINVQILEQLDRICKRLDKIESRIVKKTADKTKVKKIESKEQKLNESV